jgi:hypothetical protein
MSVPVIFLFFRLADDTQLSSSSRARRPCDKPSRRATSTLNQSNKALTHFAPTPCRPRNTYRPLPIFPPACKFVGTNSTTGILNWCYRPEYTALSHRDGAIDIPPQHRWCNNRPISSMELSEPRTACDANPLIRIADAMPGRFRTASRPQFIDLRRRCIFGFCFDTGRTFGHGVEGAVSSLVWSINSRCAELKAWANGGAKKLLSG